METLSSGGLSSEQVDAIVANLLRLERQSRIYAAQSRVLGDRTGELVATGQAVAYLQAAELLMAASR